MSLHAGTIFKTAKTYVLESKQGREMPHIGKTDTLRLMTCNNRLDCSYGISLTAGLYGMVV